VLVHEACLKILYQKKEELMKLKCKMVVTGKEGDVPTICYTSLFTSVCLKVPF
jgi:hypothetical protein